MRKYGLARVGASGLGTVVAILLFGYTRIPPDRHHRQRNFMVDLSTVIARSTLAAAFLVGSLGSAAGPCPEHHAFDADAQLGAVSPHGPSGHGEERPGERTPHGCTCTDECSTCPVGFELPDVVIADSPRPLSPDRWVTPVYPSEPSEQQYSMPAMPQVRAPPIAS